MLFDGTKHRFKDTSGPALNILIKMMSLISLVLAPSFRAVNPTGQAFPENSWWYGLIIIIVVGAILIAAYVLISNSYTKLEEQIEEAAANLEGGGCWCWRWRGR